jgi:hypothetical protein
MLYEIRDYHYRRDLLDAYKKWAEEAVPVLRDHLDVVGFWVDAGIAPDYEGTDPGEDPLGAANVTWIIRWESKEARDRESARVEASEAWQTVWARNPDPDGYRRISVRFMESM